MASFLDLFVIFTPAVFLRFHSNQTVPRGHRRTRVQGARVLCTIGSAVSRSKTCVSRAARSNCHTLLLSYLSAQHKTSRSMPTATRLYCVEAPEIGMLALVFGHWSGNFGRL
jgi:hypothetical protein